ncbi:MAG: hypothetical protein Q8O15_07145 [Rectinemataceae bacterium]|nr:hypothetical protein [Rectinemataceae bacterium]
MPVDFHTHLDLYDDVPGCLRGIAAGRIFCVAASMDIPSWKY